MSVGVSLIAELEDAIQSGSKDKRVDTLRRITDLFITDADLLNDKQIEVFDDVLGHLIKRNEAKALAELSQRLGPVKNAPVEVVRRLACDDNIIVAEPILTQSTRLTDNDLIEITKTKTQGHLLAISARSPIGTLVTDALLERGERQVYHRLAANSGAQFSENGFATLVKRAEGDDRLAESVGRRIDVPVRLFRKLLLRATEAVRNRLLALVDPGSRDRIQQILASISEDASHEATIQSEHDYAAATARMLAIQSQGKLKDAAIFEAVKAGRHADVVAGISLLCGAPLLLIDILLQTKQREALLVPCKAADLEWPTVRLILNGQVAGRKMSDQERDRAEGEYKKLSRVSAGRVLRFWQLRRTANSAAA
jgi:uncharacterized protein (DUF2336 family)